MGSEGHSLEDKGFRGGGRRVLEGMGELISTTRHGAKEDGEGRHRIENSKIRTSRLEKSRSGRRCFLKKREEK